MIDVLNGYEANPQDWGTNTLLIEALARNVNLNWPRCAGVNWLRAVGL